MEKNLGPRKKKGFWDRKGEKSCNSVGLQIPNLLLKGGRRKGPSGTPDTRYRAQKRYDAIGLYDRFSTFGWKRNRALTIEGGVSRAAKKRSAGSGGREIGGGGVGRVNLSRKESGRGEKKAGPGWENIREGSRKVGRRCTFT